MDKFSRMLSYGRDVAQGASNSIASNVSAPVDGIAWLMRKAGVPIRNPVGGSDWMAAQGLTADPENRLAGILGEAAGMSGPMVAAAKAPQVAAGLLQMGRNAMAPNALNKQSGVFIGPGAKTWNAGEAARAKALTDAGADARKVWSETGTWKGPDGAWRQEIPDNAAGLRLGQQLDALGLDKLSAVLDHKALYKGYPDTKNINTSFNQTAGEGSFSAPRDYAQYIDMPQSTGLGSKATPQQANSVALHEVQHAVQQREGWARGGNPGQFASVERDKQMLTDGNILTRMRSREDYNNLESAIETFRARFKRDPAPGAQSLALSGELPEAMLKRRDALLSPDESYRRLAGEAEARATQARIPMNAAQRRAMFPEDSYDVPLNQLINNGGNILERNGKAVK